MTTTNTRKLRAFDADLPFLASEAAFEIDNFLVGKETTFEKAPLLLKCLENSFALEGEGIRPLTDSASAALMFDALSDCETTRELLTEFDVIRQALRDVQSGAKPVQGQDKLEKIRDFFIALSNRALAASRMYDTQSAHPYRS